MGVMGLPSRDSGLGSSSWLWGRGSVDRCGVSPSASIPSPPVGASDPGSQASLAGLRPLTSTCSAARAAGGEARRAAAQGALAAWGSRLLRVPCRWLLSVTWGFRSGAAPRHRGRKGTGWQQRGGNKEQHLFILKEGGKEEKAVGPGPGRRAEELLRRHRCAARAGAGGTQAPAGRGLRRLAGRNQAGGCGGAGREAGGGEKRGRGCRLVLGQGQ